MLQNILAEADVQSLHSYLEKAQRIVVTCHVSPDGDAMGSVLAMTHYLQRKGKTVTPVVPNVFPDFLKWIPGTEQVRVYERHEAEVDPVVAEADLFVCVDFNEPSRMDKLEQVVMASPAPKIMFDHHLHPVDFCALTFSFPDMCATCELLFRVLWQLEGGIEDMTAEEATCLYTGMMTDTGGFTYNSFRGEIYETIGQLISRGIDKDRIYRNIYYAYSANRFKMMGYLLYVKMKVYPAYNAALMTLTREERKRFSNRNGDTEGFVNLPLQISGTRLSVFLREDTEKEAIRVSLRSVDDFPCNRMAAEFFNGGGHQNASGGELHCSMEKAVAIVHEALKKYAPLLKGNK